MAWRHERTPYRVLISEIMLQQTQVSRVAEKFPLFIKAFPSFKVLSEAPLKDVLTAWQGLGYNRRALYVKRIAEEVMKNHGGALPKSVPELEQLSGLGHATARSVAVFAFDAPHAFIETNIRGVFLHHFFPAAEKISDAELMPFVEKALEKERPREWYYALMDYGAHCKSLGANPSRKSAHHTKQKKFEGSDRQVRGAVIKMLSADGKVTSATLHVALDIPHDRFARIMAGLEKDGLVIRKGSVFSIA